MDALLLKPLPEAPRLHPNYVEGKTCAACGEPTRLEVCLEHGDNDECPQRPGDAHSDMHACPCNSGGADF